MSATSSKRDDPLPAADVLWLVAAGALLLTSAWLVPFVAALASGRLLDAGFFEAALGTVRVFSEGHFGDPAAAYPPHMGAQLPGAVWFWLGPPVCLGALALVALRVYRRFERPLTSHRLGRRPYDPRGARPQEWARPRHAPGLVVSAATPDRFTLGRLDRRLVAADVEAHAALVAPTRSGKTTRYAIPWALEHRGPLVSTSTKLDVLEATRAERARLGDLYVFDPFGARSCGWSPLLGCAAWSGSLRQARRLADAAGTGDSEIARYWSGEAAGLLAPLLHAAARAGLTMAAVVRWLDAQDADEPAMILTNLGAEPAALAQLMGVQTLDERNRGTTYMSAKSLVSAYRYPEAQATDRPDLVPREFLRGKNTLYLVASAENQELVAPLIVALVSSILDEAALLHRERGHGLSPTLRMVLDEAANVAPLRSLPRRLALAAGDGVRIASIWQTMAQMERLGRSGADEVLGNSQAKLFMGPVTDEETRRTIVRLLGEEQIESRSESARPFSAAHTITRGERHRPKASAQALQQLGPDRTLVVHGTDLPAIVRATPFWEDRTPPLRRMGIPAGLPEGR